MFTVEERVRFADTDAFGHMNNAVYLSFMEVARTHYYLYLMRVKEFRYLEEIIQFSMVVVHAWCDFKAFAAQGETVVIEVWPTRVGNTSYTLRYRMTEKRSGRLVAEGETVQVAYDFKKGRKISIPPGVRERMEADLPEAA